MISEEKILTLIEKPLKEKECFVVELNIGEGNNINLEVDSFSGVNIADCVDFSRAIEHNLDRDVEDFQLNVSSPGLDKPLRIKEQYVKNINRREVQVLTNEGSIFKGKLIAVNENNITIAFSYKEKIEGKKKKQIITKQETIQEIWRRRKF